MIEVDKTGGNRVENDSIQKSTERGFRINNASMNSRESNYTKDADITPKHQISLKP